MKWVHDVVSPLKTTTGQSGDMLEQLPDITDQIRTEKTLQESEKKYRLLFNKMIDGLALLDILHDEATNPSITGL